MRIIQGRMIPYSCHSVMVLFITICLWWVGCGPKAVRQESDWTDLNHQVETLYAQGHYERAVPLAEKALSVAKTQYGQDHPNVATSLNNLGELYNSQGKYAEAEPLFRQSLEISQKAHGLEHPNVASAYENIAYCYRQIGKVNEAKELEARARTIRSK